MSLENKRELVAEWWRCWIAAHQSVLYLQRDFPAACKLIKEIEQQEGSRFLVATGEFIVPAYAS